MLTDTGRGLPGGALGSPVSPIPGAGSSREVTGFSFKLSLHGTAAGGMYRPPCRGKMTMRRILLVLLFAALVASSSGCLTPEAKSQWHNAIGDLNGEKHEDDRPTRGKKPDL